MRFRLRTVLMVLCAASALAWDARAGDGPDAGAVADLVVDLGSAEGHVRDQAREGLVRIGAAAVPPLVKALEGPNVRARVEAARALGGIGAAAGEALPALRKAAESGDAALAEAAKAAVAAIESAAKGAPAGPALRVADLVVALATKDPAARRDAIRHLGAVRGPEAPQAAEALAALLSDPDDGTRVAALRSLESLGPAAAAVAPVVVDALVRGRPAVRPAALDALARMPEASVPAVLRAAARIHEMQSDATGAEPWLMAASWDVGPAVAAPARAALAGEDAFVAAAAADALGAARSTDPDSVAALVAATQKGPAIVRRRAAFALGALGGAASEATVDPLVALLGDAGSRAQVEAAEALRQVLVDLAERPARPTRTPADAQKAIDAGLDWLVVHQDDDGRLDCDGFEVHDTSGERSGGAGSAEYDVGVTGLAALALLRSGATGRADERATWHDVALRKALRWIASQQGADGCVGPRTSNHWIYGHAIGALALSEAWARTRSPLCGAAAQRALDFLASARNPESGWRYEIQPKDTDTSVNGWCVQAMRAGERAGLRADRAYGAAVLRWLDSIRVTEPEFGRVGYQDTGKYESARTTPMLQRFPPDKTTALTSSAAFQRFLLGRDPKTDPLLAAGLLSIQKLPPVWDTASGRIDLYSWLPGTEAMSLAGGDAWERWRKAVRTALVAGQCGPKTGARAGSWDTCDPWSPDGGRVYTTSMAVLCLEVAQGAVAALPKDPTRDGRGLRAARALEAAAKDPANHESVREAARAALAAVRGQ